MLNLALKPVFFLADAWLMFFALPWLMVLLVLGTVAQHYIGLYAAQKLFFGSFVLWVGLVPLPGAYSMLALIGGSLLAKLVVKSEWSWKRSGTLITHASAIILLLGGLISMLGREEGYVVLANGQNSAEVSDYRQVELEIRKNEKTVATGQIAKMLKGEQLDGGTLPFRLRIIDYCYPCVLSPKVLTSPPSRGGRPGGGEATREDYAMEGEASLPNPPPQGKEIPETGRGLRKSVKGLAAKFLLKITTPSADESQNLHGALFEVSGINSAQDGIYLAYDMLASPASFKIGPDTYSVSLHAATRPLPFNVRLQRFTKSDYPGTDEARAYRSEVAVKDGPLEWNAVIEMNQPLRYKGYTLYQSSFVAEGDKMLSVLAVVKNAGEWFPYIAISMLCFGLLLHIFIILRKKPVSCMVEA